MPELILNRVYNDLKQYVKYGPTYLAAYSGGPDSTFLLYVLSYFGYRNIVPVYINYKDSPFVEEEHRIVQENCRSFGYALEDREIPKPLTRKDGNFEDAARKARYGLFARLAPAYRAEGVLVAHQQDDLICTYLMQKERGGVYEHYGMKAVTTLYGLKVIRPFLNVTKAEMIGFLKYKGISYYDDLTNYNRDRTRNRIREEVLPTLNREKILQEIDRKNAELQGLVNPKKPPKTFSYAAFEKLSEKNRRSFLHAWIRAITPKEDEKTVVAGVNLAMEALRRLHSTRATEITPKLTLYRNYDDFYLMKSLFVQDYEFKNLGKEAYENDFLRIDLSDPSAFALKDKQFPLTLRNVREGDVFATGLPNGSVKNFLRSQKVPLYLRYAYPCLTDQDGNVVYVPFYEDIKKKKVPLKIKRFRL